MDFAEAIEFSKKFPACHPKVFKGFLEWEIHDTKTDGYVVITDTTLMNESASSQLDEYIKRHKLTINFGKDYLMISTHC